MNEPGSVPTGGAGWAATLESAGVPVAQVKAKAGEVVAGLPAGPTKDRVAALVAQRPEVAVGAAFVGGLLMAMIVRRLGS